MRFGSVTANRDVSLDVYSGEAHAIVGENGAGKSTLMKVLFGHYRPESGEILLDGKPAVFRHPREAMRAGIGMVHQQLLIFPQLTALENIVVGCEAGSGFLVREKESRGKIEEISRIFGFDLPLDESASRLSFAHRQQIELLRVLYRGARILILDEPTSLLAPPEVKRLLDLLKSLRKRGHTILFVSHRLKEVFELAERITVLRRGQKIGTFASREISEEELAQWIVAGGGESSAGAEPGEATACTGETGPQPAGRPLLELVGVTTKTRGHEAGLDACSLTVKEGEILGIGGVVGNGQADLACVIAGLLPAEQGSVLFDGREIGRLSAGERMRLGLRRLPANPLEEALLPGRPLWENLLLGRQREPAGQSRGWLLKKRIARWAEEQLTTGEVVHAGIGNSIDSLSGGNQQKVALSRVLAGSPKLVVLEQPGRGLDIRALGRLQRRIRALGARGVSFLLISFDLDELLSLSDRIGILYRGRLAGLTDRAGASRERLGAWMLGLEMQEKPGRTSMH
ncbi:MAG: ABC transporter ATP-binding protein [Desulfobacteraceae bacterium]|nr:ABC transporter ATP-binding protein [Desulfobacteraceae bacterium]